MKDVFLTDNAAWLVKNANSCVTFALASCLWTFSSCQPLTRQALGIVATKSTGSIHGLTYFNDAMDELCAGGGGCPTVVHRDLFMQYNFRSFMAACLAGCLVSTLSAVQLLPEA